MSNDRNFKPILSRLSDRNRAPRSWWFPVHADPALSEMPPDRVQQDFMDASSAIAKTAVTIMAFSFFCVFTLLGAPDRELIAAGAQITIPVVKVGVSFTGFLILGPILLLAFFLHLHTFVAYWLALREVADHPRRGGFVFNFPFASTRRLSSLLFYWLVPVVIGVFAWKSAPQPVAGRILFLTFLVAISWTLLTQIRRRAEPQRHRNLPQWIILGVVALALMSSSGLLGRADLYSSLRSLRGGLRLEGADLTGQNLSGRFLENANLSGALLEQADLRGASLASSSLRSARLSGADLTGADLRRADMSDAVLAPAVSTEAETGEPTDPAQATRLGGANLQQAVLAGADLTGAVLVEANLSGARLSASSSGRSAILSGADLRRARFENADLMHVDLRGANLIQARMRGANLSGAALNPTDDGTPTDMTEASLIEADLIGADLRGATMRGANLSDADLSDADLTAVEQLSRAQVAAACADPRTPPHLPETFRRPPPACAVRDQSEDG